MDEAGTRREGGALLVEDGRIAALYDKAPPLSADLEIDATGMLLTPGLVNTHHHFYQTLTRNLPEAQDEPLFPWLRYHYEVWRELDEESLVLATRTALAELLLSGCTLTSDHHYLFPAGAAPDLIDRQIEVAAAMGIRFQPTRGSMSLGRSRGGLPPDDLCQDEETILADCRRLIERYHDPNPGSMLRIDLAPCSPFSVTEAAMRETAGLAREAGVRLHTHVAETLDEERFCLEQSGLRPVAFMESLGWSGCDTWYAHAVHLDDAEIARMGASGTGVAHCPSSNMRLGSGIARVRELLDAGAPVGLAVDGSASNDGSHLLAEARQMLLLSRLREHDRWLGAEDVFRVATRGGAQLMGRSECGSIAVGQAADLVLWDLGTLDLAGTQADPLAGLLFTASAPRAHTVIINGELRVKEGRIPGFGERAHAAAHNEAAAALLARSERRPDRPLHRRRP
jgi:cytosine/adenosine deaminase-related metal-dependent hydrolase